MKCGALRARWLLLALPAVVALAAGSAAAKAPPSSTAKAAAAARAAARTKAGRMIFLSTCGVCHRLSAAGTTGVVGPDLDQVKLSQATIVKAITNGGATVMTRAKAARYETTMTAYRNALTTAQIEDVALYVYSSMRAK